MDNKTINNNLAKGEIDVTNMFPHVARLQQVPYIFSIDFGLTTLPLQPGIVMIRGARQYGKSTWLEQQLIQSVKDYGGGSTYYLNGENFLSANKLQKAIENLLPTYNKHAKVKRLFIDEITTIPDWEIILKRMVDNGQLRDILVITTGSKATDLRRGSEKLPGRKGKLTRSNYLFTPISFKEFYEVCGNDLGDDSLMAYVLSGGSPIACSELASTGTIPEYVIELVRDWIEGEITATGRNRISLRNIMAVIFHFGGSPVGQAKLAREAGLANNSVAQNYIEILNDLACIVPSYPWDQHRNLLILRKPCKYHFSNLLAAVAYHPSHIRKIADFQALPPQHQAVWYEWLIAQELQRRAAIKGDEILMPLAFWQNKHHEIDFVVPPNEFIEVKRGSASAMELSWFTKQFPQQCLTVINNDFFETEAITGTSLQDFLLAVET